MSDVFTRALLERLIRIPSVSADPSHVGDVAACADALAAALSESGATNVAVLRVDGAHPLVCGDFHGARDDRTLLVYGHYDVQPPGRSEDWITPPFEPVERDGRLFGRGSADDKGGLLAYLAAVRAFGTPPCNVRFLIEGEEEIGSPNLSRYFAAYRDRIQADFVAICDTPNFDTGRPALTYRLRGNCTIDVEVRSLERPLHSGRGGGAIPDPIQALAALIAGLSAFNEGAEAPSGEERQRIRALDVDDEKFRRSFGVLPSVRLACEPGYSPLEQTWLRPSLTVTAFEARPMAEAANQIVARARARLSIRTVPNMDHETLGRRIAETLRQRAPHGVEVSINLRGGPLWWRGNADGAAEQAALRALSRGFGRDAVAIGSGGSIGFVRLFADTLPHAPCLLLGVEDPPCNAHSENESLHLGDWQSCMRSAIYLFEELAAL